MYEMARIINQKTQKLSEENAYYDNSPKQTKKTQVSWLFERFLAIWDKKWLDKIDGMALQKREVWSNAIDGLTRKQLETGLKKSALKFIWPPEIKEFVDLCIPDNITVVDSRITPDKAIEIAENKIKGRFTPRNYTEAICERDAITALQAKILRDQNDAVDVTFCNTADCYKFVIANGQFCWNCQEHAQQ